MLASPLAGSAPRRSSVEFRDHRAEIASLRQVVPVASMPGEDEILATQMRGHADRRGLLSDAEMCRTTHLLLGIPRCDRLLDQSDAKHLPKHGETDAGSGCPVKLLSGR